MSAPISGSVAERRIQCTGSFELEKGMPNETSQFAAEGTALHALMYEAMRNDGKWDLPHPYSGSVHGLAQEVINEKFWPAHRAMLELVVQHKIIDYELELRGHHAIDPAVSGVVDFAGRSKDGYLVVVDYKFGSGVKVSPVENFQLAFYAVGLFDSQPELTKDVEKVIFAIVQPWPEGPIATEWETDIEWLHHYRSLEEAAYHRIKLGETSLKPGSWCRFCRGKPICGAHNQYLTEFDGFKKPVAEMPTAELAHLLDIGERAAAQYADLVKYATRVAERGVDVPGYKLIRSIGNRRFTEGALRVAQDKIGNEAFEPMKLRSPTQMEKAFKKTGRSFTVMEPYIERPDRGVRLVRDDHPGAAVNTTAEAIELPAEIKPLLKKG